MCQSGDNSAQYRSALLLLSALQGAQWTNDHPLERGVVRVLEHWDPDTASGTRGDDRKALAAAAVVKLTGETLCVNVVCWRLIEYSCLFEGIGQVWV